jgi:DNA-binding transcriptional regulator YbjK
MWGPTHVASKQRVSTLYVQYKKEKHFVLKRLCDKMKVRKIKERVRPRVERKSRKMVSPFSHMLEIGRSFCNTPIKTIIFTKNSLQKNG